MTWISNGTLELTSSLLKDIFGREHDGWYLYVNEWEVIGNDNIMNHYIQLCAAYNGDREWLSLHKQETRVTAENYSNRLVSRLRVKFMQNVLDKGIFGEHGLLNKARDPEVIIPLKEVVTPMRYLKNKIIQWLT